MHPLVQSAIQSANAGENNKAIEFLKQALAVNPNDVDAWLVLAAVVDDPQRKRQCLNRALAIDPTNQIAIEELEQMDRAEAGELEPSPIVQAPENTSFELREAEQTLNNSANPSLEYSSARHVQPVESAKNAGHSPVPSSSKGKVQVFQYPLIGRIFSYALIVISFSVALFIATKSLIGGFIFFVPGFVMLITTLIYSHKVEVGGSGVRVHSMFTDSRIRWDEITDIRSSGKLELIREKGGNVNIPKQIDGYLQIFEMVRQRRPDLFRKKQTSSKQIGDSSPSHSDKPAKRSDMQKGATTFSRSFFNQYGLVLYIVFGCSVAIAIAIFVPEYRLRAFISVACCIPIIISLLLQVGGIRLEKNNMVIESIFYEKIIDVNEIRDIRMQLERAKYRFVTINVVKIMLYNGRVYTLTGFSDGEEILYARLMNWWRGTS